MTAVDAIAGSGCIRVQLPRMAVAHLSRCRFRQVRILRLVWKVIGAVHIFNRDRVIRLQVVGTEINLRSGGEDYIAVFHNRAECNILSIGKLQAMRPSAGVIFRQVNSRIIKTERLVIPLRVDIRTRWLRSIPEVIR